MPQSDSTKDSDTPSSAQTDPDQTYIGPIGAQPYSSQAPAGTYVESVPPNSAGPLVAPNALDVSKDLHLVEFQPDTDEVPTNRSQKMGEPKTGGEEIREPGSPAATQESEDEVLRRIMHRENEGRSDWDQLAYIFTRSWYIVNKAAGKDTAANMDERLKRLAEFVGGLFASVQIQQSTALSVWENCARQLLDGFDLSALHSAGVSENWIRHQAWCNSQLRETGNMVGDFLLAERHFAHIYIGYLLAEAATNRVCPLTAIYRDPNTQPTKETSSISVSLIRKLTLHEHVQRNAYMQWCNERTGRADSLHDKDYLDSLSALTKSIKDLATRDPKPHCKCRDILRLQGTENANPTVDSWRDIRNVDCLTFLQAACPSYDIKPELTVPTAQPRSQSRDPQTLK